MADLRSVSAPPFLFHERYFPPTIDKSILIMFRGEKGNRATLRVGAVTCLLLLE